MKQNNLLEINEYWLYNQRIEVTYFNGEETRSIRISRHAFDLWLLSAGLFAENYWQGVIERIYGDIKQYLLQFKSREVLPKIENILDYDNEMN